MKRGWLQALVLVVTATMASASWAFEAGTVDLRRYLPADNQVVLSKSNGQPHARYTFKRAPSGFVGLYTSLMKLNKAGYHYTWQKEYLIGGAWCTKTYAVLFVGDDGSVTEVGDWMSPGTGCTPGLAFGYRDDAGSPSGLIWAPAGGLSPSAAVREVNVFAQAYPGAAYASTGHRAFSKTGLVELIPELQVGQYTFRDVVHLVMYHGTKAQRAHQTIRCDGSPIKAAGPYYQSYRDFNSYAVELWLAPGVGVIQESTPFIEDASYWGRKHCTGQIFDPSNQWGAALTYTRQVGDVVNGGSE